MEPTRKQVDQALATLDDSPRALAKAAVKRWKSDAERFKHPVSNVHDDKGASPLNVKAVLDASLPDLRGKR